MRCIAGLHMCIYSRSRSAAMRCMAGPLCEVRVVLFVNWEEY